MTNTATATETLPYPMYWAYEVDSECPIEVLYGKINYREANIAYFAQQGWNAIIPAERRRLAGLKSAVTRISREMYGA